MSKPRVAIAHDYLTQRGGAERVVLALHRAFPDAPVYTTLYEPDGTYPEFRGLDIRTSHLDRVAPLRRHHRAALPLLPLASSSVRIDADVVIASSSGWSHGFRTTGRKLVYCYSPARWLYESDRYLGDEPSGTVSAALRLLGPSLRRWDFAAALSADRYLAISTITQDRIRRTYGLGSEVVPAPHSVPRDVDRSPADPSGLPEAGYFLLVSRLLAYKNVAEVVEAFRLRAGLRLLVVGAGPQKAELVRAAPPNVTFVEGLSDAQMVAAYRGCVALVAASHEDFGLTPLEAAAHGKPSIVLRWGGFLDTVIEDVTGIFFDQPEGRSIASALDRLGERAWNPALLRARADEFGEDVFAQRMHDEVDQLTGQRPAI